MPEPLDVLEALHSTPARRYLSTEPISDDVIRELPRIVHLLDDPVAEHGRFWAKNQLADRDRFAADVLALLYSVRLVAVEADGAVRVLPAAARYAPEVTVASDDDADEQPTLL